MSVRAKFQVNAIERVATTKQNPTTKEYEPSEVVSIRMTPVYSDDPKSENRRFWEASPSGALELCCANPAAVEQFKLGGEYYLDFTPAE
tara:strand:- start:3370 stop:3636 length:267 start_codon:yes stop_codon:yes gene_type:complete